MGWRDKMVSEEELSETFIPAVKKPVMAYGDTPKVTPWSKPPMLKVEEIPAKASTVHVLTAEERARGGRQVGGAKAAAGMTPEQRHERAKKAAQKRWGTKAQ